MAEPRMVTAAVIISLVAGILIILGNLYATFGGIMMVLGTLSGIAVLISAIMLRIRPGEGTRGLRALWHRACFHFIQDGIGQGVYHEKPVVASGGSEDKILVLSTSYSTRLRTARDCCQMLGVFTIYDFDGSVSRMSNICPATSDVNICMVEPSRLVMWQIYELDD